MKRVPSAMTAIGGFSVAVAALSVATTAGIVVMMPDPPARRMTVSEAAAALRGADNGLERRIASPPAGPRAPVLEAVLARQLGRAREDVRLVWLDPPARPTPRATIRVPSRLVPAAGLPAFVLRRQSSGRFEALSPEAANLQFGTLLGALPQPAFAAGVRDAAGQWVTVAPRQPWLSGWRLRILAALALSLLLLAPLAWLFARRLTRPFRSLAAAIDSGEAVPPPQGPRELRDAAGAIVQLRSRLAQDAEERMRMLSAIAHDLRTPLTSLRLRIEGVPEPQRSRMVADTGRMQVMIDEVLSFARTADAPRQRVAVRAVIAEILEDLGDDGDRVRLLAGAEMFVMAVPQAFRRAVENLARNAIDYAGGAAITVAADGDDSFVVVRLTDAGPGIAAADRARLMRPFERGDASRNRAIGGAGLGLSIVSNFAELHGGTLSLDDADGGGLVASLRLPMAMDRPD